MRSFSLKSFLVIVMIIIASPFTQLKAQGLFDFIQNEEIKDKVENIVGDVASDYVNFSIIGRWSYKGATLDLKSENTLSDLGSSLVGGSVDNKVNEMLEKLGVKPGALFIAFEKDSTFTAEVGKRKMAGTFSYDKETNKLTMTFLKKLPIKTGVKIETKSVSFLYNADALLRFVQGLGGKINMSALSSLMAILNKYENLNVGLEFEAEDGRTLIDSLHF